MESREAVAVPQTLGLVDFGIRGTCRELVTAKLTKTPLKLGSAHEISPVFTHSVGRRPQKDNGHIEPLDGPFRHRIGERRFKAALTRAERRAGHGTTVDIAFGSCFDLVMGSNRANSLRRRHRDLPNSVFEAMYGG
jgi:hypothetical protein